MPTTLATMNPMKSPLETGTGAGEHNMKGEDLVDKVEFAASSALSKVMKAVMSILNRNMALLCSIYDIEFTNMVEEEELEIGGNLSVKADFVLADHSYSVQSDRKHDHAKYHVLGSGDKKPWPSLLEKQ